MLVVSSKLKIPLREIHFSFARSSGAGGQNVNKLNTKAVLRWSVSRSRALPENVRRRFVSCYHRRITSDGTLVLTSQRFREQGRNVADCLEKLRAMLAEVEKPPRRRKATRPTRASVERRLKQKREKSVTKGRRERPKHTGDD